MNEEGPFHELSTEDIERALVDGHWRYGSLIHLRTAEALVGVLAGERDPEATHILFSRLFGEYAATLETFAAWAWAMRNRFERGSFLDAYLGYRNHDVGEFYALVREHDGDLSDLLRLPPAEQLVELGMERDAELPREGYSDSLRALYDRLKEAAEAYFATDRVIVDAYNKTKHGAPMLRLFEPNDERKFEIVMRVRNPSDHDPRPYRFSAFTVSPDEIEKQRNNVEIMTDHIRDLASVTKMLLDADALYVYVRSNDEETEPEA